VTEPSEKLVNSEPQRVLRIDPMPALDVDDREEEVPDLFFDLFMDR